MRGQRSRFGHVLVAVALLASFAAVFTPSEPVAAAGTSVTIHNSLCSTTAKHYFNDCHSNAYANVAFSIGGTWRTTNSNGVASANVAAGKIRIYQDPNSITDAGQYIYCSVQHKGRVLYSDHRKGGSIYITLKAGEKVICDWYNLYKPAPQGVTVKIHSYDCPVKTKGNIFTQCHRDSKANAGTVFWLQADAGSVYKRTSSAGTFTKYVPTASSGWVYVTITQDPAATTKYGAYIYCSSAGGHPGSGDVLGGVTDYDGQVTVKVKDGTTFTCDWYNRT